MNAPNIAILCALGAATFFLSGCSRSARLYPANDLAASTGVLQLNFVANGSGHGEGNIQMPDGELLKGEYSLVRGGALGFGSVIAAATSPSGVASATGSATTMTIPGGSPGTASLFGDHGTSMLCEIYNDNFSGHGYGGCKSSNGGIYHVQY